MRTTDPAKAERIFDAAIQLFAERPYHEVRMDDIAVRTQVAKGTLYLHFKDKEIVHSLPRPWPVDLAERVTNLFLHGVRLTEEVEVPRRPRAVGRRSK